VLSLVMISVCMLAALLGNGQLLIRCLPLTPMRRGRRKETLNPKQREIETNMFVWISLSDWDF
jgi:hypothetical protein